jgi:hypothetical protein
MTSAMRLIERARGARVGDVRGPGHHLTATGPRLQHGGRRNRPAPEAATYDTIRRALYRNAPPANPAPAGRADRQLRASSDGRAMLPARVAWIHRPAISDIRVQDR